MGKQFSFFLTPGDVATLFDTISRVEAYAIVHDRSSKSGPLVLNNYDVIEDDKRLLFFGLMRAEDLDRVVMRKMSSRDLWIVDYLRSPAIRVTLSFFDGGRIRRGRMHYDESFFGETNDIVVKHSDFLRWATSGFALSKKALKRSGSDYFGAEAFALMESGKVELLD